MVQSVVPEASDHLRRASPAQQESGPLKGSNIQPLSFRLSGELSFRLLGGHSTLALLQTFTWTFSLASDFQGDIKPLSFKNSAASLQTFRGIRSPAR